MTDQRPDPVDVLAAAVHPDTRRIDLDDRTVLRTPARPDDLRGNAVLLHGEPPDTSALVAALADATTRLSTPGTTPRVLVRAHPVDAAPPPPGTTGAPLRSAVLVLPDAAALAATTRRRHDVRTGPPTDDRGWHGVTVLRRHAADDDPDEAAARARGGRDELLRWWVDGRRRLVGQGRARVLVATRFGTPVGAGSLLWEPGADVGPDAAGLAVVADVVVHPAHRGLGVATTVVAELVARHVADFPRACVAVHAPATLVEPLAHRGWELLHELVEVRGEPSASGGSAATQR